MRVVIAGGTGFLGSALAERLQSGGHEVHILSRRPAAGAIRWSPDGTIGPWAAALDGADAIVNLAGESIASGRWTEARKARILNSRVLATRSLATAIRTALHRPVFLSGSAVGYY